MNPKRALSFDSVASAYDRYRPRYCEALFDDLFAIAGLSDHGRGLEIGCGTGIATIPIARRGLNLVCLEPGAELARIARKRLAGFTNCTVSEKKFEDWAVVPSEFDLVYSAQTFHWLDPATRFEKVASALVPNGMLAIFGYVTLGASGALRLELKEAYKNHAPALVSPSSTSWYARGGPIGDLIRKSGLFGELEARSYTTSIEYLTDQYLSLLQTHSDHNTLPDTVREDLFGAIGGTIDTFGGRIDISYDLSLFVARRITSP